MATRKKTVIRRLYKQGLTTEHIASKLGLVPHAVRSIIHSLPEQRLIDRESRTTESHHKRRGRQCRKKGFWHDPQSRLSRTVIRLVKKRATLKDIGNAVGGVTKERARQIIKEMKKLHGENIFIPSESDKLYTPKEAAHEAGCSYALVCSLCRNGDIPITRRGANNAYIIDSNGLMALKKHPLVTRQRECTVCGSTFTLGQHENNRTVCSDACKSKRYHQRYAAYPKTQPSIDTLTDWRGDLWSELQSHTIPENEQWLTISQATKLTGLSKSQLVWIRRRNIVTTQPHPTIMWRGRPVAALAESEMKIVRRIYESWQQHKALHKKK